LRIDAYIGSITRNTRNTNRCWCRVFLGVCNVCIPKTQETKDQLDETLLDVESFSSPTNYIGGSNSELINEEGELDWDGKIKQLLMHATSIYSYLDYEEKYGIPRDSYTRTPDDDEVVETCRSVCLMFHYLFVAYPFSGKSMVNVQGVTEKLNIKKALPFDKQRLHEVVIEH